MLSRVSDTFMAFFNNVTLYKIFRQTILKHFDSCSYVYSFLIPILVSTLKFQHIGISIVK